MVDTIMSAQLLPPERSTFKFLDNNKYCVYYLIVFSIYRGAINAQFEGVNK